MTLLNEKVNDYMQEVELTIRMNLQWAERESAWIVRKHYTANVKTMLKEPQIQTFFCGAPEIKHAVENALQDLETEEDKVERMVLREYIIKELTKGGVLI